MRYLPQVISLCSEHVVSGFGTISLLIFTFWGYQAFIVMAALGLRAWGYAR